MKPFDPRLARRASGARAALLTAVGCGLVTTALVLLQAGLIAHIVVRAGLGVHALRADLAALAVVLVARAAVAYGAEAAALRGAAAVKSQLRRELAARALARGPQWLHGQKSGELTTLATRGLDALDPYFARYLPQLVLAAVVPVAVLVRVASADVVSAVTIGVTLPLIPLFMVLVGLHTRARTERQWLLLARLGGHFLDVVEGLPTLKVFGRARAQAAVIRRVTDEHRRATMATLRVAFLSAFVLELLATIATALVAVEVGLRLLNGNLGYETALLVLLLAPEAYLPLRAVGAQFHASVEGVVAAEQALDIIECEPDPPVRATGDRTVDLRRALIRFDGVDLRYAGRDVPALQDVTFAVEPGERVAFVGESGAGKSSMFALLLRLATPTGGCITVDGVPLDELAADEWRRQIAWVPQRAHLFEGSIADNIRLGDPQATEAAVRRAADLASVSEFAARLPAGLDAPVGEGGRQLSSGQRQRVAIARALVRDPALLLLDEPTAHLDERAAAQVQDVLQRFSENRTVLVISHVHGWAGDATRVITVEAGRLVSGAVAELAS